MIYTTTRCRNCGYKTRNHESNVSKVQLNSPILVCPACGKLILDSISTEYEFMTEKERKKFTYEHLRNQSMYSCISNLIFSLIVFISGFIAGGSYIVLTLFVSACFLFYSVMSTVNYKKIVDDKLLEQSICASLKRTSNANYVIFIQLLYEKNNIKRNFLPFTEKLKYLDYNKDVFNKKSYKEQMETFNNLSELFEIIDNFTSSKQDKDNSTA